MPTSLSEFGEFALIARLRKNYLPKRTSTIKGIGDDAAVLEGREGTVKLVTTDLLLEGIHFDLTYTPLKHLGYKAVVVNLSDIYAMNGQPEQITVSVGVSAKFSVEQLEELYGGIYRACNQYNVDLIGGDTSASVNGLLISVTCVGSTPRERVVYRNGAEVNDLLCVTGNLGAAYMGLLLLEREKRVFLRGDNPYFEPKFEGREYIIERQLKPEPRADIVSLLAEKCVLPSAMIDISDGLSSELLHIAKDSGVGIAVYEDRLPIDFETAAMAEELNLNVLTAALNGGEDYELLMAVPLKYFDTLAQIEDLHIIGKVTDSSEGCRLITRDDTVIPLLAQGWNATDALKEVDETSETPAGTDNTYLSAE